MHRGKQAPLGQQRKLHICYFNPFKDSLEN